MLFNSFSFLIFFPAVTVLYFLTPHRFRWALLLTASCFFYMAFIPIYILVLALTIAIDYTAGILIERRVGRKRKFFLVVSIVSTCSVLFLFKYFNFFNANLASLARLLDWNYPIESLNLILPIGLSFHTFQSLSYVIEVYRGNYKAEKHPGIYALYVMFYPQLVAGPIERPENLIHQLREQQSFDADRVFNGLKLMAWGFFKKVVIADRIAVVVDEVYRHPTDFTGIPLIAAAIFFGIQVYCDFSGYSDIAIGSAQVMGIRLMQNFNRPLHSTSVTEFWRRWHISLMTWFRDYVYIPLGGNRLGKGRRYLNLFLTFTLSGLWHGAGWGFVLWGSLNGGYLIFSNVTESMRRKWVQWIRLNRLPVLHKGLQIAFSFLLFCFTLIIFRAKSLSDAMYVITHLGTGLSDRAGIQRSFESLYRTGFDRYELIIAGAAIGFMEFIYWIEKRSDMRQMFSEKPVWMRWTLYYALVFFVIVFGVYYEHAFIYFQF
jgi:alginate O-acetyltransferase complex protein AlgI